MLSGSDFSQQNQSVDIDLPLWLGFFLEVTDQPTLDVTISRPLGSRDGAASPSPLGFGGVHLKLQASTAAMMSRQAESPTSLPCNFQHWLPGPRENTPGHCIGLTHRILQDASQNKMGLAG